MRTVSELFDMLNGVQDQAMQQGPGAPGQGYSYAGTGYSDYGAYGSGNRSGRSSYGDDAFTPEFTGDIGDDIKNAVIGGAAKFLGRSIGKKVSKAVQERVVPAMQAKMAQAQQQAQLRRQQATGDQAAIVQRYPDLRGCLHDQVVFLAGGTRTFPITDIRMPVTLAQADAVVDRLRAP